jgi:DNA primase
MTKISKLTEQELEMVRGVSIHRLLAIPNTGRRYSMPCPIHNGRNPNFNVYSDNSYHCFKCGANGKGAIDFVMALGFSFVDAVEEIIKIA